jgi:mRNA interferase MazF
MRDYKPGEILLLAFPFSDGTSSKRFPVLVLMDTGDEDIIVARITSQTTQTNFDVPLTGWEEAGLKLPSTVRLHKIATLEKNLIERKLGELTSNDWEQIQAKIQQLWNFI